MMQNYNDFFSYYMYEHPLEAISKKDLDILTEEAGKKRELWTGSG